MNSLEERSFNDLPTILIEKIFCNLPLRERLVSRAICSRWDRLMPFRDYRNIDLASLPLRSVDFDGQKRSFNQSLLAGIRTLNTSGRLALAFLIPRIGNRLTLVHLSSGFSYSLNEDFLHYLADNCPNLLTLNVPSCNVALVHLWNFPRLIDIVIGNLVPLPKHEIGTISKQDSQPEKSSLFVQRRVQCHRLFPSLLAEFLTIMDAYNSTGRESDFNAVVTLLHFASPKDRQNPEQQGPQRQNNEPMSRIAEPELRQVLSRGYIGDTVESLDVLHGDMLSIAELEAAVSNESNSLSRCHRLSFKHCVNLTSPIETADRFLFAFNKSLTHLNLTGCVQIHTFDFLSHLKLLTGLNLSRTLFNVPSVLRNLAKLEEVDLSYCIQMPPFDPDAFQPIHHEGVSNLRKLILNGCEQLCSPTPNFEFLRPLVNIRHLELAELFNPQSPGVALSRENFGEQLNAKCQLETLNLSDTAHSPCLIEFLGAERQFPFINLSFGLRGTLVDDDLAEAESTDVTDSMLKIIQSSRDSLETFCVPCLQGYNGDRVLNEGLLAALKCKKVVIDMSALTERGVEQFIESRCAMSPDEAVTVRLMQNFSGDEAVNLKRFMAKVPLETRLKAKVNLV